MRVQQPTQAARAARPPRPAQTLITPPPAAHHAQGMELTESHKASLLKLVAKEGGGGASDLQPCARDGCPYAKHSKQKRMKH